MPRGPLRLERYRMEFTDGTTKNYECMRAITEAHPQLTQYILLKLARERDPKLWSAKRTALHDIECIYRRNFRTDNAWEKIYSTSN